MLRLEQYRDWVLPSLLKIPAWEEFVDALLGEIITLQMFNMGSMNKVGFNGVPEPVYYIDDLWVFCESYNENRGEGFGVGFFGIGSESLDFVSAMPATSEAVYLHQFVLGRKYKIRFRLEDLNGTPAIQIGIGRDSMYTVQVEFGLSDPVYEFELEASDYFLLIRLENQACSFKLKDLEIVGQLTGSDEKERVLVMKRLVGVDVASREILERMRDDLAFPKIPELPEYLLRQIIRDHNTFVGYGGAEMAGLIFFYFMGYDVEFISLYAEKSDYNSKQYAYIQQKKDDILVSTPSSTYARVMAQANNSYNVRLFPGHQVVVGDMVCRQTQPFFTPIFVEVIEVRGDIITLANRVTVGVGAYLDIYRKYKYAVNPNPANYIKTSHVDIYFKQKYSQDTPLSFDELEELFIRYLPVNVVIRFFGYKQEPVEEEFVLLESSFRASPGEDIKITFLETTSMPTNDYAQVVWSPTPATHTDLYGNPVDGYSYVIGYMDGSNPVYLKVPLN